MSVLNWTSEQRARVAQAIAAEIERVAISHKFIDSNKVPENSQTVAANVYDPQTGRVNDGAPLPILELAVPFLLTKLQAEDPALDSALTIIKRSAVDLARGQDAVIFRGDVQGAGRCLLRPANPGLQGLLAAGQAAAVGVLDVNRPRGGSYAESMIAQVSNARAQLDALGFSGGYVMVMGTGFFAEANRMIPGSSERPIKVIEGLIEGAVHSSVVIPAQDALLVSATSDAIDRAVATPPALDYGSTRIDNNEERQCRLYTRFTPRLKDARCVIRLHLA